MIVFQGGDDGRGYGGVFKMPGGSVSNLPQPTGLIEPYQRHRHRALEIRQGPGSDPRPGCFTHVSIITPIAPDFENCYMWVFLEAPTDILSHFRIQVAEWPFRGRLRIAEPDGSAVTK
jgi:hypothetical protein